MESVNIGGNVTINDGAGSNGQAGYAQFTSMVGSPARSVIKGNLSLTFADGTGTKPIAIEDYDVGGNLKISEGKGSFTTEIGQLHVAAPVVVHGNVTIKGSSAPLMLLVGQNQTMGLDVLKNLTVNGGTDDTLTLYNLHVGGATKFNTGNGANQVTIDDSHLCRSLQSHRRKRLRPPSPSKVEAGARPRRFSRKRPPFKLALGATPSASRLVPSPIPPSSFESSFIIHHGADAAALSPKTMQTYTGSSAIPCSGWAEVSGKWQVVGAPCVEAVSVRLAREGSSGG